MSIRRTWVRIGCNVMRLARWSPSAAAVTSALACVACSAEEATQSPHDAATTSDATTDMQSSTGETHTDELGTETSVQTGDPDDGSDTTGVVEEPKLPLVIIGGALAAENHAVHDAVLDRRQGEGPLCILPIASNSPEAAMQTMVGRFDERGGAGTALGVLLTVDEPERAFEPAVVRTLEGCSGFFFTGGLQSRITTVLRPEGVSTPALDAIYVRHLEGAVVSGSSAGAAIMSDPMISGGNSAAAMDNGTEPDGVRIRDGLGFFEYGIVDQHFLARGRIGRLMVATLEIAEFDLGFGIDENTALVVDGDIASVMGASGVVIVDTTNVAPDASGSAMDLRLHLVGDGDEYDLKRRRPSVDPNKLKLEEVGGAVPVPSNVFASWALLHLLVDLSRSNDSEVVVPVGEHQLTFRKALGFEAVRHAGEGVQDTPAGLTLGPVLVDVHRG